MKDFNLKDIFVLAPILLISFFSGMNIADGFNFSITDTTVNDAIIAHYDETEKISNVDNKVTTKLATVKTAASSSSYNTKSNSSSTASSSANRINISGNSVILRQINCANSMPTPNYSSAYYCYFRGSGNLFIYGHNTNNIFGKLKNLSVGSTFTITLNNQTTTYKITNKFSKTEAELNDKSSAEARKKSSELRTKIYSGTYGGNSDITIQTCHGANDSERLYIKAVRV